MSRLKRYILHRSTARWILAGYGLLFVLLAIFSEGSYGGGDSLMHYLMARYAPQHPSLFLDQWGKPLFTLLSCIPSQAGFTGIKLFNVFCALLSAALFYRMGRRQFERWPWLSIIFVLGVPVYFVSVFSGLTEPLFAACLVLSIYLFHNYRERWACLVISFLPFIRSEGYLILPLFLFICLYYRKWKAIPLLFTGIALFTIAGFYFQHTWNWVFGTNVYLTQPTDYGHGSIFRYILLHREISGWAGSFFILAAVAGFVMKLFAPSRNRELMVQVVLVFGSLAVYFSAHSWFWYRGIYGSAGIARVMAGIGPCIGYTAFCGFQFLMSRKEINENKPLRIIIWAMVAWAFIMPRYVYSFPFPYSGFQKMQIRACDELKKQKLEDRFIYFEEPFIPVVLNFDPFDASRCKSLFHFGESLKRDTITDTTGKAFKPGSIIIWDSRLCPREGMLPKDLLEKLNVKLLQSYSAPDEYHEQESMEIRIYEAE